MGKSAANRPGNVREFYVVWRVVTLYIGYFHLLCVAN